MSGDEEEQLQRVADATESAIQAEGWLPVKVVVLASVIVESGEQQVAIAISRDMQATDTLGLLRYATVREETGVAGEASS